MSLGGVRVVRLALVLSGVLSVLMAWAAGSQAATPAPKPGRAVSTKDEVVSARTQTSRTFRQPDGSNVTQVSPGR
jgi:hypothetical protein